MPKVTLVTLLVSQVAAQEPARLLNPVGSLRLQTRPNLAASVPPPPGAIVGFSLDASTCLVADDAQWRVVNTATGEVRQVVVPDELRQSFRILMITDCTSPTHCVLVGSDEEAGLLLLRVDGASGAMVGRVERVPPAPVDDWDLLSPGTEGEILSVAGGSISSLDIDSRSWKVEAPAPLGHLLDGAMRMDGRVIVLTDTGSATNLWAVGSKPQETQLLATMPGAARDLGSARVFVSKAHAYLAREAVHRCQGVESLLPIYSGDKEVGREGGVVRGVWEAATGDVLVIDRCFARLCTPAGARIVVVEPTPCNVELWVPSRRGALCALVDSSRLVICRIDVDAVRKSLK